MVVIVKQSSHGGKLIIEEISRTEWIVATTAIKFYRKGLWNKITDLVYSRKLHLKAKTVKTKPKKRSWFS